MSLVEKIEQLDDSQCMVDTLLKEVGIHKCKDCGKCTFGYEGITQLEMALKDISEKRGKRSDYDQMMELCGMMKTQSICEDGIEIASCVSKGLEIGKEEVEAHINKKGCRAGVCSKFMSVHIIAAKCIGCGDCMDACDEDAILGKSKFVHVIDQDECTGCGKCIKACDEDAIVLAGADKPKCPKKPIPCKKK